MEALLEYLRKHQENYTNSDEMAGVSSSRSRAEMEEYQTKLPVRKYVSVFRIDGIPIIPPLMTSEKRRQMQKLKEKALKVEQRLKENKLRLNSVNDNNEDDSSETSRSSGNNIATGSITQRSQDYYEAKLKETEESMMILHDLLRRQSVAATATVADESVVTRSDMTFYKYNANCSIPRNNEEKLMKLQKSETLIYDNTKNEVKKHMPLSDQDSSLHFAVADIHSAPTGENEKYLQPKKPNHLLLASVNGQAVAIPSICINPPTPLVGNRQICEPSSATDDQESFFVTDSQHISQRLPDEMSSDESFNSMYTHSDDRPPPVPKRNHSIPRSQKIHNLKAYNNNNNTSVTAKIQKFEAISSDNASPNTTPNSSPDKSDKVTTKLQTNTAAMSRSATSPSIRLSVGAARSQTSPQSLQSSPDNALIRSSSFTLEAPSKALIDHMRQQRCISERPPNSISVKNTMPSTSPLSLTKKMSPISRVQRDTIESKAKRVQKVELKPSRQKTQQKTSQQKLAQAAAASMSPYKSKSPVSTSTLYKTKKSPYDTQNYTKSAQSSASTKNTASQAKRSLTSPTSMVANQKTTKVKSAETANHSNVSGARKAATPDKEVMNQMDKLQKEKFMRLLQQQEDEQRKLKQAFEMQQKLLLEQLNKEMAATQINSPPTSCSAMPSSRSTSVLSHHNENLQQSNLDYLQQTLNISNVSSLLSEETLAKDNSLYTQVPSLPLSNLSSIDHSNANTSLDSSAMFATCDQSTQRAEVSPIAATTPLENCQNMSASVGANSTSRRRLFPHEPTASMTPTALVDISVKSLSMRSSSSHRLSETQRHQLPNAVNKAYVGLTNTTNNRRPIKQQVVYAAATKINAYARGFLVRRLFQTEQIQRIVQTIRDTLIFVLNLHIETCENPEEGNTPANIKLKARLLQQLSSASRTLHLVLFQTTVKERMDIIARDRKRIKTKLMAMRQKRYIK